MDITLRAYQDADIEQMRPLWNEVVEAGDAFPQVWPLTLDDADRLYAEQSFTGVAEDTETGEILGLYILHPNNEGRCGHIANASYAVKSTTRGRGIGEKLVLHSMETAKKQDFRILQFNAVVKTNHGAICLYEKLGFVKLGVIKGGFLMKDGTFEDIIPFYKTL
ncbi:MAG: GNAT family N-acetyltransferase [Oscillospiraceae bacterium]|nr:GNAT family N-acetyltransferase [Oscillospiraceae bacterium]